MVSLRSHDDWLTVNCEHKTYQSQRLPSLLTPHTHTLRYTDPCNCTCKITKRAVGWDGNGDRGSPLQMRGCNCISCLVGRGWAWVALKWTQSGGHIKPLVALQPSASLLRRISCAAFQQRLTQAQDLMSFPSRGYCITGRLQIINQGRNHQNREFNDFFVFLKMLPHPEMLYSLDLSWFSCAVLPEGSKVMNI